MGFYESIINANPFIIVLVIAFVVNLVTTIIYKYTTNQDRIRELKKKQKDFQKEIRELQKKSPEKAMKKQKEAMAMNGELMKSTLKPTLYTIIPLFILFGWINSALMYEPILPGEQFTVTADFIKGASGTVTLTSFPELKISEPQKNIGETVEWNLSGNEGRYQLTFDVEGTPYRKAVLITTDRKYEPPEQMYEGVLEQVTVSNEKVRPFGDGFKIFGNAFNMIWAYIILSIFFSIIVRKLMKVA